jgi:5-oxoprolinase (ATP-hydrolysing)
VHRRLVTIDGAARNYGVVVRSSDYTVDERATKELREKMRLEKRVKPEEDMSINRGGTISELMAKCKEETGLEPPRPQWEKNPYGPHVGIPYVKQWYKTMREGGMAIFDKA